MAACWRATAESRPYIKRLRHYLYDVTATVGISTHIVPHQFRHTYATEMIRAGVSLPVLMAHAYRKLTIVAGAAKTKDAARQHANATRSVAAALGRTLRIGIVVPTAVL